MTKKFVQKHDDQEAFKRLKAELAQAFAAPDSSYQHLTVCDIISRNAKRPTK